MVLGGGGEGAGGGKDSKGLCGGGFSQMTHDASDYFGFAAERYSFCMSFVKDVKFYK